MTLTGLSTFPKPSFEAAEDAGTAGNGLGVIGSAFVGGVAVKSEAGWDSGSSTTRTGDRRWIAAHRISARVGVERAARNRRQRAVQCW